MALFGNFKIIEKQEDWDNTTFEERFFPEELGPEDPDYDKRGQTLTVEVPGQKEVVVQSYENVYALIRIVALHTMDCDRPNGLSDIDTYNEDKSYYAFVRFNLYNSEEDRRIAFSQPIVEHDFEELLHIHNINDEAINANGLYAWCYEQLATLPQCEEMENV
jgi:hypothetical protein